MKKKLFLTLVILLLVVIVGVVWYITPSKFLKNVSADDIKFIHIFNGNNGSNYTIGEKQQISYIVENLQNISFEKSGLSFGKKGYLYRLTFEDTEGKIIDKFIINSNDTLRNDPFFYHDGSNSI